MSKTYLIEKATKVALRGRVSLDGQRVSLYLDWGSKENRQYEFLRDKMYYNPKSIDQKQYNDNILINAKEVLYLKNIELLKDNTLLIKNLSYTDVNTFIEIVKKQPKQDGGKKSTATVAVYECVKKAINEFRDFNHIRLKDVNERLLWDLRQFFLDSDLERNSASIYFSKFGTVLKLYFS